MSSLAQTLRRAGPAMMVCLALTLAQAAAADVSAYLRTIDQDGDGLISAYELKRFPRLGRHFEAADADRNGVLDREELATLLTLPTEE